MRCELISFYEANRERRQKFYAYVKEKGETPQAYAEAIEHYSFFDVDDSQYGMLYLDLKVVDQIGMTAGTAFDNKLVRSSESTRIFHLGPTLSDQNTYQLVWNFTIKQDAALSSLQPAAYAGGGEANDFPCYMKVDATGEQLARNEIPPDAAMFKRILVNGSRPLASWILDNGKTIGSTYFAKTKSEQGEQITPAQMLYSFAIQTSAGLDTKLSVTGLRWNPAAVGFAASSQQTSAMAFYVNGPSAALANGAKGGSAIIKPKDPRPIHVIIDKVKAPGAQLHGIDSGVQQPNTQNGQPAPSGTDKTLQDRKRLAPNAPTYLQERGGGQLLYPLPILPPVPSQ
ncbi:MAG: hypothetical protein WC670_10665 [Pseudolabrys sp.]